MRQKSTLVYNNKKPWVYCIRWQVSSCLWPETLSNVRFIFFYNQSRDLFYLFSASFCHLWPCSLGGQDDVTLTPANQCDQSQVSVSSRMRKRADDAFLRVCYADL